MDIKLEDLGDNTISKKFLIFEYECPMCASIFKNNRELIGLDYTKLENNPPICSCGKTKGFKLLSINLIEKKYVEVE